MTDQDEIAGFMVGGTMAITVANLGCGVLVTVKRRDAEVETMLSVDQVQRLRKLLGFAAKRATQAGDRP